MNSGIETNKVSPLTSTSLSYRYMLATRLLAYKPRCASHYYRSSSFVFFAALAIISHTRPLIHFASFAAVVSELRANSSGMSEASSDDSGQDRRRRRVRAREEPAAIELPAPPEVTTSPEDLRSTLQARVTRPETVPCTTPTEPWRDEEPEDLDEDVTHLTTATNNRRRPDNVERAVRRVKQCIHGRRYRPRTIWEFPTKTKFLTSVRIYLERRNLRENDEAGYASQWYACGDIAAQLLAEAFIINNCLRELAREQAGSYLASSLQAGIVSAQDLLSKLRSETKNHNTKSSATTAPELNNRKEKLILLADKLWELKDCINSIIY